MRAAAGRLELTVRGQQGIGAREAAGGRAGARSVPPAADDRYGDRHRLADGRDARLHDRRAEDSLGTATRALLLGLAAALTAALDLAGR